MRRSGSADVATAGFDADVTPIDAVVVGAERDAPGARRFLKQRATPPREAAGELVRVGEEERADPPPGGEDRVDDVSGHPGHAARLYGIC